MSKVDWITWKTDPKEIINPNTIEDEVKDYYHSYESYMNSMIYDQIQVDLQKGGLSKEAFNVSGISPANEMAIEIINAIDEVKHTMKNLQEAIREVTLEQKSIEKKQLISAIEDKISKEKALLESVKSKESTNDSDDIIYIINDRIKKLNERLDIAKTL